MSLTIFSTLVLSLIFVIVLSTWQVGHGSVLSQLAMLGALVMMLLSFSLLILRKSLFSTTQKTSASPSVFDGAIWSTQISAGLSTPAAVIRGYIVGFANRPFLEELGMPNMAEELVGMPLTNLVHPKDHQNLAKLIAEIGSNSQANPSTIKLRLIRFDGSTPAFDVSLSRLSNDAHEPLLLLQFNLGNTGKATLDNQFNYRLFVEQIEQIIFQHNIEGHLIFVNPSWEKLLNQSADEVIQKPFLAFIHPEDRPIAESHLNAIRFGKRASCHLEVRMISRSGEANWFEMRARATSSAEGEKTSIIGTLTD
ncbi:MAG: PAS domain-containing protein, partial [Methylophilaceae bacterium]